MARRGPMSEAKRKREAAKREKRKAKRERQARRAEERAQARDKQVDDNDPGEQSVIASGTTDT